MSPSCPTYLRSWLSASAKSLDAGERQRPRYPQAGSASRTRPTGNGRVRAPQAHRLPVGGTQSHDSLGASTVHTSPTSAASPVRGGASTVPLDAGSAGCAAFAAASCRWARRRCSGMPRPAQPSAPIAVRRRPITSALQCCLPRRCTGLWRAETDDAVQTLDSAGTGSKTGAHASSIGWAADIPYGDV